MPPANAAASAASPGAGATAPKPACELDFSKTSSGGADLLSRLQLAEQNGIPMTLEEAKTRVANEDRNRKTYVQQDLDGNDYSSDDQVRARPCSDSRVARGGG